MGRLASMTIENADHHIAMVRDDDFIPTMTSFTIENAILTYLEQADIPISRISSFGSDGAAVMVGAVSGITTRLKRLNPEMLSVHCINHRLALGVSQAANTVPYLKNFEEILISLYKFYHNNAVRQTGLEEIQTIFLPPSQPRQRSFRTNECNSSWSCHLV